MQLLPHPCWVSDSAPSLFTMFNTFRSVLTFSGTFLFFPSGAAHCEKNTRRPDPLTFVHHKLEFRVLKWNLTGTPTWCESTFFMFHCLVTEWFRKQKKEKKKAAIPAFACLWENSEWWCLKHCLKTIIIIIKKKEFHSFGMRFCFCFLFLKQSLFDFIYRFL